MLKFCCEILQEEYQFIEIYENVYEGIIREVDNGKEIYSFKIRIDLNPILISELPIVIETENDIPNNVDNHKYTYNNSFCFGIGLHERIIFHKMVKDFRWFVEKQVKGFLSAYVLKDLTGKWGAKEFSHNELLARKESLIKLLGIYNFSQNGLGLAEFNIRYKKGKCYCGSGKDYNHCHINRLYSLNGLVTMDELLYELYRIKELSGFENN